MRTAESPAAKSNSAEKPSTVREFVGLVRSLVIFLAIALMLRASVVEAFKIPSSSMEMTLQIGDHILVNKLSYGLWLPFMRTNVAQFGIPSRGDIVVFTLPDDPTTPDVDESDTNLIKRVIGLPGDRVEVRGTNVYINGAIYSEDDRYARWVRGGLKDFSTVTIPESHVFLLGDNRDLSRDARFWPNPFLPVKRIKGRAFVIYWNSQFLFNRMFTILR